MKYFICIVVLVVFWGCKKSETEARIDSSIDSSNITSSLMETEGSTDTEEPLVDNLENVLLIPVGYALLRFNNVYGADDITIDSVKSVDTLEMFVSDNGGIIMSLHNGSLLCDSGNIDSISVKTRVSHSVAIGYDGSSGMKRIETITPVYSEWSICENDSISFRLPAFDFHISTDIFTDSILSLAQTALNVEKTSRSSAELSAFVYSFELEITNGDNTKTVICNFTEI